MSAVSKPMMTGPLSDLSVVEFGDGTSGPYAAKMLGDYGARVVKIEVPGGDSSRTRGPFPDGKSDPEASGLFLYLNTNKFGVVIDVAQPAGRAAVDKLLEAADVFVTNQPLELLQRAGLDPAILRERHPGLIVTTISPFGSEGPWANFKSDEIVAYATSGMAYATPGMPDASEDLYRERPLHPNCYAAETVAGLVAAVATMTAVLGRRLSNQGCHIEVSEQAASATMQIRDTTAASYSGMPYNRLINPHTIGRMPNFYLPCKDGYVTIAAPMDIHWDRLVEAMGSPAWALAPEFSSTRARIDNWIALRLQLIEWTMTIEGDAIYALAEKYQLPFFPFYSVKKVLDSAQVQARESVVDVDVGGHPAKMPGAPLQMRGSPWMLRHPAPRLGEHNSTILHGIPEITL
jgi:crotonobetainyl-CoA:carnitine CoA-transferase CaiB-like acyl-CoA transferase